MEKLDVHDIEGVYRQSLRSVERFNPTDRKLVNDFLNDISIGKNSRKKVGKSRRIKYIQCLHILSGYFKKPLKEITSSDVEGFYRALDTDKVRKTDGRKFSAPSKNEFVKTLKKFGNWLYYGEPEKYAKNFGWLKNFAENKEIPALRREDVDKLVLASDVRDAAIIMTLFDSGARIEEFLNLKINDITKVEKDDDFYYKIRIRVSKTKPRTITLPMATNYLARWLSQHLDKDNPDAYLFPLSYDAVRMLLLRKGKKILNKRVYPHLMRHTSATHYANLLNNPFKLAYRFGWTMGSKEPQRYIDREGIEEEETVEIVNTDEIGRINKENKRLKEEIVMLKSQFSGIENQLEGSSIKKMVEESIAEVIKKSGKKFDGIRPVTKEEMSRGREK